MSEAVKNLLKDVGVDFGEKDSKENVKKNFLLKQRIKSPDKFLI